MNKTFTALFAAIVSSSALVASAINQFAITAGGTYDWNANTNWTEGVYPNGVDAVASCYFDFEGSQTYNLNETITLGTLYCGDAYNFQSQKFCAGVNAETGEPGLLVMKSTNGPALIKKGNAAGGGGWALDVRFETPIRLDSDLLFSNSDIGAAYPTWFKGSISGTGRFIKFQQGNIYFGEYDGSPNTYTGETVLSNGLFVVNKGNNVIAIPGDVRIAGGEMRLTRENNVADSCVVTMENNGFFNVQFNPETIRGIQGESSESRVEVTSGNLTLVDDTDRVFAGKLTGNDSRGTITKKGAGLWTLSGDVSYAGKLAVAGTGGILADTVLSNAMVSVSGGGIFGGSGVVSQQVTCATGVLAPGSKGTGGTLELAGGIAVSGSVGYTWKLGALSETQGFGRLLLSGGTSVIGADRVVTLDFSGLAAEDRPDAENPVKFWRQNHSWTIFELAGEATCEGAFASLSNGTGWGARGKGVFTLVPGENDSLVLNYTAPVTGLTLIVR